MTNCQETWKVIVMRTRTREDFLIVKDLNVEKTLNFQGTPMSAADLANAATLGAGVTASAAELNKLDGVTASTAELNALDNAPLDVDFVIGAQAGDVINVGLQLNNADGTALATRAALYAYLSDDANGDSIAATAPDGGVAIGTDGLAIPLVAAKAFLLVSEADGDIDLDITESGATTWYLVLLLPNGKLVASAAITFA